MLYNADPYPVGTDDVICVPNVADTITCVTVYHSTNLAQNGDKNMYFFVAHYDDEFNPIDIPAGTWSFFFEALSISGGSRLDAYSAVEWCGGCYFSSPTAPAAQLRSPGTANNAITVGSYVTDPVSPWGGTLGEVSSFSSPGPTRDGRLKPEIIAPGQALYSTESADWHSYDGQLYRQSSGTSMAAPVVAGSVALLLQADPTLDSTEVRAVLTSTARTDVFTGATPNTLAGYGKLNLLAALGRLFVTDPGASLAVGDDTAPADGATTALIGVQLKTTDGRDVVGHTVSVAGNPATSTITPLIDRTRADGTAIFHVTSTTPGPVTYTFTDTTNGVAITDTHTVTFIDGGIDDATLVALDLDQGSLTPSFGSLVTAYTARVPNEVSAVSVSAVTGNPLATLEIDHLPATNASPSAISLAVGPNPIPVVVTAEDGVTTRTYMLTVTRGGAGPGSDTSLSSLTVSDWELSPAFDPSITSYAVTVPYDNASIFPSAITTDPAASMSLEGWYWSGTDGDAVVLPGSNEIEILVTASDGFSQRAYTITATRGLPPAPEDSTAPSISSLAMSTQTVDVTASSAVITVDVEITDPSGFASAYRRPWVQFRSPSGNQRAHAHFDDLVAGSATDGTFRSTLTIPAHSEAGTWRLTDLQLTDAMRNANSLDEADLIDLGFPTTLEVTSDDDIAPPALLDLDLTPSTVTSANGRIPIEITVLLEDDPSGVSLTGLRSGTELESASSPNASHADLDVPVSGTPQLGTWTSTNWLAPASVVSPDLWELSLDLWDSVGNRDHIFTSELETLGYPTTVTVLPSDDPSLRALNLSTGVLFPAFAPEVTVYEVAVDHAVSFLAIAQLTAHVGATTFVNGDPATDDASTIVPLDIGPNPIDIVVTAEDGSTQLAYTVIVTRAEPPPSDDATLSALTLSAGTLAPAFTPVATSYTAGVANDVTAIDITATTNHAAAVLTIDGVPATSGAPEIVALAVGLNPIDIIVAAEDGSTELTYIVTITRAAPDASEDATLTALTLSAGTLDPAFDPGTTSYTADVGDDVESVDVTATTNDGAATLIIEDTPAASGVPESVPLAVGANAIGIVVTAEDGVTQLTYTVTVTRAESEGGGGGGGGGGFFLPPPPPPQLRVDVTITNDDGGTAAIEDFTILVDDFTELTVGEGSILTFGGHVVSLDGPTAFYTIEFAGTCFEDGTVILLGGLSICTVMLDDQPLSAVLSAPLPDAPALIDESLNLSDDAFDRDGVAYIEASSAGTPPEVVVAIPIDALPDIEGITIVVSPGNELAIRQNPPPGSPLIDGTAYVIEILDADGNPITEFPQPLELSFLLPERSGPVDAYSFDPATGLWVLESGNIEDGYLLLSPSHLTTFALFGIAPDGGLLGTPPSRGIWLTTAEGGSVLQLRRALLKSGAVGAFVTHQGEWVSYLPSAPDFVNQHFVDFFASGIAPGQVLLIAIGS